MVKIMFCPSCKRYTLLETCICGEKTKNPSPPRYKPSVSWARYRRLARKEALKA